MNKKEACLIIHGFTGGPFEVMPLAEYLAGKGYEVKVPTLPGHADKRKELGRVTYHNWIAAAEKALIELLAVYKRVNIIGFSMGGLIGIHLSAKYKINALVCLSTPINVLDLKKIFENIYTGLKDKNYERIGKYAFNLLHTPPRAVLNFRVLLRKTKPLIKKVSIPFLVMQGLRDDTVKPKSAEYIYKNAASVKKKIHYLSESKHIICCDIEKEQVFCVVADFLGDVGE